MMHILKKKNEIKICIKTFDHVKWEALYFFNNIVIKIFIAKKVVIPTTMKNIFSSIIPRLLINKYYFPKKNWFFSLHNKNQKQLINKKILHH
jgi:hypothetical protein